MTERATNPCPYCGEVNDCASGLFEPESVPSAGDVSICLHCAGVTIYNADLTVRVPAEEERLQLEDDPQVALAVFAVACLGRMTESDES